MSLSFLNIGQLSPRQRRIWFFVLLSVLVLMIVQYARLLAAEISYSEAIQHREGGGDALWSVWKRMYGYPVYTDAWELPFSNSNYNFLFYDFYAFTNLIVMKALHLGDEWMQVISSHVSLLCSLLGAWFFSRSASNLLEKGPHQAGAALVRIAIICAAVAVSFGPMLEEVPTTQVSHPGAFMLQMLAFLLLLRREGTGKRTTLSLLPIVVACYLSWAFRQTYVELPVAFVIYLATQRRWKEIAIYSLSLWALFGVTFWLMRDTFYWQNTVFVPTLEDWSLRGAIVPFLHLAAKAPQSIAGLLIIVWSLAFGQKRTGTSLLLLFAGITAFILNMLASTKPGGHCSYYLPFSAYAMLLLLEAVFVPRENQSALDSSSNRKIVFSTLFYITFIVLGAAAIFGIKNRSADRHEHYVVAELKASLDGLPRPVYVSNSWLYNMPWLIKTDTPIVRAWLHSSLKKTGRKPAHGGVEGLEEMAWFGTVAIPIDTAADDPVLLRITPHYHQVKTDDYHAYWTRKSDVVPPEINAPVYKWPAHD